MAVLTSKLAFLHIPKTAGTWVLHALKSAGIDFKIEGSQHGTYIDEKPYIGERFIYTQVRCPLTWLASAYCFICASRSWPGSKRYAVPIRDLDTSSFSAWVYNWVDAGLSVHDFFHQYTVQADLVGKMENCLTDLSKALTISGHRHNPKTLNIERINTRHSGSLVEWKKDTISEIRETQDGAFTAYGYDECFDIESCPCSLGG